MAYRLQVSCVIRSQEKEPNLYLRAIGGEIRDGGCWLLSQQDAIKGLDSGRWSFFLKDEYGVERAIVVGENDDRQRFLKVEGEGQTPERLLRLKPFPNFVDTPCDHTNTTHSSRQDTRSSQPHPGK
jgi:hypothetical protein